MRPPDWAARVAQRIGANAVWAERVDAGAVAFDLGDRSDGACFAVALRESYFAGAAWAAGLACDIMGDTIPPRRARQ